MYNPPSKLAKKLTGSVIAIIVLSLCLTVTTSALVSLSLTVDENIFSTGKIEITLGGSGDGNRIIAGECIAPGMTLQKTFTVHNGSTDSIYYKLYFENISGGLADLMQVTILHGETTLYSGILSALTEDNVGAADDLLPVGETRELTILFHLPASVDNRAQSMDLQFDFSARAVQSKNNENKNFN